MRAISLAEYRHSAKSYTVPTLSDIDHPLAYYQNLDCPYRALLTAILERAIRDAAQLRGVKKSSQEQCWYSEAKQWLGLTGDVDDEANSYRPWTYSWVCQHLDIDPIVVRSRITELLGEELYHRLVYAKTRPKLQHHTLAHKGFRCGGDRGTMKVAG